MTRSGRWSRGRVAASHELEKYERKLSRVEITWLDGSELGVTSPRTPRRDVTLFPYNHDTFLDMSKTLTHEVVHLVHPDFERNEGAVEAITLSLMKRPAWVRHVQQKLGEALFDAVILLKSKRGVAID